MTVAPITLQNFSKMISSSLLNKAKLLQIRECDEIEPGHFQAYVDDRSFSYDTAVTLSAAAEIREHQCDCQAAESFCAHQAALILYLKKSSSAKRRKKITPADQIGDLLYSADPGKLRNWVSELLANNKELALAFVHEFAPPAALHTAEEIRKLTADAVKAVLNNRKKADIAEVKKIVGLWEKLHEHLIAGYCADPGEELSFSRLNALVDAVREVSSRLNTSSVRFSSYLEDILKRVRGVLEQFEDELAWTQAVHYFCDHILREGFQINTLYLSFLVSLHQGTGAERKELLARMLATTYMSRNPGAFDQADIFTRSLFQVITRSGLFEEYYLLFSPITYSNEYNYNLIEQLLSAGHLPLAEKFCWQQIERNSNTFYDEVYLDFLIHIYSEIEDDYRLALVYQRTLPFTFDFDTYVFVRQQLPADEGTISWRNSLLAKARLLAPNHFAALMFCFKLTDFEQQYERMINYIDKSATYPVLIIFLDKMLQTDRAKTLRHLLDRPDHQLEMGDRMQDGRLPDMLNEIYSILLKYFSVPELQEAIRRADRKFSYERPNELRRLLAAVTGQAG